MKSLNLELNHPEQEYKVILFTQIHVYKYEYKITYKL